MNVRLLALGGERPRRARMAMTFIAALSLGAWLYLTLGRARYWHAGERLEPVIEPAVWPEVIAIIPARDEAETIGAAVAAHMATNYPGQFSVLLVDDGSRDGTAGIARAAAADRRRFIIAAAPPLAPGWTGKLAAVQHGVARARAHSPGAKYLLLTDADIMHAPSTLRRLVAKAEGEHLALASLMARLDSRGAWGSLLVPAFVYFFQKLYPFPQSNNPASKVAAAAGGCILVRRDALEDAGGIEAIGSRLIDDCALAELIKAPRSPSPRRIWIGLARDEVVSLRDNRSLSSIWSMVARSAFAQLDRSWLKLAGTVAGMALVYLAPAAVLLLYPWHEKDLPAALAAIAFGLMSLTYVPTLTLYNEPSWKSVFLPAAAALYTLMTISSALQHARGGGGRWKGRTYP